MSVETTYSNLRRNLAAILKRTDDDNEVFIVRWRRGRDIALIPADELSSILETMHLLRSPANAKRLIAALRRADSRGGERPDSAVGRSSPLTVLPARTADA